MLELLAVLFLVILVLVLAVPKWIYVTAILIYSAYHLFIKPYQLEKVDLVQPPRVEDVDIKKNVEIKANWTSGWPETYGRLVDLNTVLLQSFVGQKFIGAKVVDMMTAISELRKIQFLHDRQTHNPIGPVLDRAGKDDDTKLVTSSEESKVTKDLNAFHEEIFLSDSNQGSIVKLLKRYKSKETAPTRIADAILKLYKTDKCNSLVQVNENMLKNLAQESERRWENGQQRLLEGIPFAVKEMCHVPGYFRNCGVSGLASETSDIMSETVQKLIDQGAMLVGMTNLHQLGIGITGINSSPGYKGGALNPHSLAHYTGGSSSGSASVVASNLVCFAIGNDGGGSIRLPASQCGLVGLKATWGRISMHGENSDMSSTVTHSGPMCRSVADAALVYGVIAGYSSIDQVNVPQPIPRLPKKPSSDSDGSFIVGIWREWHQVQGCNAPKQMKIFEQAVEKLSKLDWFNLEESFRIPEMFMNRSAHLVTITSEMSAGSGHLLTNHTEALSNDVKVYLTGTLANVKSADYITAGKQRTRAMKFMKRIFQESDIDCFICPTVGADIGVRHPSDGAHTNIRTNYLINKLNFIFLGNLTGLPGISVPCGFYVDEETKKKIPVGLHIYAPWWREDVLLDLALKIEEHLSPMPQAKDVYYEM